MLASKRIVQQIEVCAVCHEPMNYLDPEDEDVQPAVIMPIDHPETITWYVQECDGCAFGVK